MECPTLTCVKFLTNDEDPSEYWRKCVDAQNKWIQELSTSETEVTKMAHFVKQKTVDFIWDCNQLEDTLPQGVDRHEANKILKKALDHNSSAKFRAPNFEQLVNHLEAYKYLCQKDSPQSTWTSLSEDIVKHTHKIMMQDLETEDGEKVHAGMYRKLSVHAGTHVYPSYQCVPSSMAKIVTEYESKASKDHDPYKLASWLFFRVVCLHPFEDGNGRLSRLLWCYSLLRDGLPFPPVLSSNHRRSQKHLVWCLNRDRRLSVTEHPHITTLTIVSVARVWSVFLDSLQSSGVLPMVVGS